MSNFFYDEKPMHLATLPAASERDDDLTPFLKFGLRGIAVQSQRLANEIRRPMVSPLLTVCIFKQVGALVCPLGSKAGPLR
jgi:hypothetical protein